MNIIDEMRREAGNAERSGHTYESLFMTEWADRLAASGALVPVPDGDACELMHCKPPYFVHDGNLFTISTRSGSWVSTHTPRQDDADSLESFHFTTPVLPVRLVAITEVEI